MELIWSNDGVSTLLLPAKILLFPEEKENKSTKNVKMLKETPFANFPESGFRSDFGEISYISAFPCVKIKKTYPERAVPMGSGVSMLLQR
jgi:hypothetical protein